MATIPDALDVANALEDLAAGIVLDADVDRCWLCVVVDVNSGEQLSAGFGLTANEAAGAAWVSCLPVAQLLDAVLGPHPAAAARRAGAARAGSPWLLGTGRGRAASA